MALPHRSLDPFGFGIFLSQTCLIWQIFTGLVSAIRLFGLRIWHFITINRFQTCLLTEEIKINKTDLADALVNKNK